MADSKQKTVTWSGEINTEIHMAIVKLQYDDYIKTGRKKNLHHFYCLLLKEAATARGLLQS